MHYFSYVIIKISNIISKDIKYFVIIDLPIDMYKHVAKLPLREWILPTTTAALAHPLSKVHHNPKWNDNHTEDAVFKREYVFVQGMSPQVIL